MTVQISLHLTFTFSLTDHLQVLVSQSCTKGTPTGVFLAIYLEASVVGRTVEELQQGS